MTSRSRFLLRSRRGRLSSWFWRRAVARLRLRFDLLHELLRAIGSDQELRFSEANAAVRYGFFKPHRLWIHVLRRTVREAEAAITHSAGYCFSEYGLVGEGRQGRVLEELIADRDKRYGVAIGEELGLEKTIARRAYQNRPAALVR